MDFDIEDADIECDGIGELVCEDFIGNKFYNSFINRANSIIFDRGDCVKVSLSSPDKCGERFGYAQINAIFITKEDHALVEVRWINKVGEIEVPKGKKRKL